jgi:exopolysaccharide production protein ExoQ
MSKTTQYLAAPQSKVGHFPGHTVLAMMPMIAVFYVLLALPFQSGGGGSRIINNIFWPVATLVVLVIIGINRSKIDRAFLLKVPVLSLAAYFVLAGASVFWAFYPSYAFSRFVAHLMAAIVIVAPYALPIRTPYTVVGLQVSSAIALVINAFYVFLAAPSDFGYAGYFNHKQELGSFGAIAVILAFHGLFIRGWMQLVSASALSLAVWILVESGSKSTFAFAFFAIAFAAAVLLTCWAASYVVKITPAYILVAGAIVASFVSYPMERIGFRLYGDPTLTGRTEIWDFINSQIARFPWFGWGFHSYYFVPNSPNLEAPGFVRDMPSSHSGYLELLLETGRIGYWIFLIFVFSSLHGLEQLRRKDPARAWLFLTIAIYAIFVNLLDSYWLVLNQLWFLFLVVTAETLRGSLSGAVVPRAASQRNRVQQRSRQVSGALAAAGVKRPAAKLNI